MHLQTHHGLLHHLRQALLPSSNNINNSSNNTQDFHRLDREDGSHQTNLICQGQVVGNRRCSRIMVEVATITTMDGTTDSRDEGEEETIEAEGGDTRLRFLLPSPRKDCCMQDNFPRGFGNAAGMDLVRSRLCHGQLED